MADVLSRGDEELVCWVNSIFSLVLSGGGKDTSHDGYDTSHGGKDTSHGGSSSHDHFIVRFLASSFNINGKL
jgi:hypothetical protein